VQRNRLREQMALLLPDCDGNKLKAQCGAARGG
jgi:hypothetical protein